MTTRWWWLRHAPVPGGRITGRLDVDCDTSDHDRLQALAARLPDGAVLLESGLRRCRRTAAALGLHDPIVEADLAEQDFGVWQGRSWAEMDVPDFWADPAGTAPPGGESFAAVCTRVAEAVRRLGAEHAGRDVVAVAHAGTIRAALALALDLSPAAALRLEIAPLSLTRIDQMDGGWRVLLVNG